MYYTPSQNGLESNGKEEVLHIPQSSIVDRQT